MDTHLAQGVMRSNRMTIDPFLMDFAKVALDKDALSMIKRGGLLDDAVAALHAGFSGGNVAHTEKRVLDFFAQYINSIDENGVEEPNAYLWIRGLITRATCHALLGQEDPIAKNSTLIEDIWYDFLFHQRR